MMKRKSFQQILAAACSTGDIYVLHNIQRELTLTQVKGRGSFLFSIEFLSHLK